MIERGVVAITCLHASLASERQPTLLRLQPVTHPTPATRGFAAQDGRVPGLTPRSRSGRGCRCSARQSPPGPARGAYAARRGSGERSGDSSRRFGGAVWVATRGAGARCRSRRHRPAVRAAVGARRGVRGDRDVRRCSVGWRRRRARWDSRGADPDQDLLAHVRPCTRSRWCSFSRLPARSGSRRKNAAYRYWSASVSWPSASSSSMRSAHGSRDASHNPSSRPPERHRRPGLTRRPPGHPTPRPGCGRPVPPGADCRAGVRRRSVRRARGA
jgi:hypothetical protein